MLLGGIVSLLGVLQVPRKRDQQQKAGVEAFHREISVLFAQLGVLELNLVVRAGLLRYLLLQILSTAVFEAADF